jgi:DNA-binding response OmpR family regulator
VRLLVAGDEPRIASFLAKGLRARGYDVEWASTGVATMAPATSTS